MSSKRVKELNRRLREIEDLEHAGSALPEHKVKILKQTIYLSELEQLGAPYKPVATVIPTAASPTSSPSNTLQQVPVSPEVDESGWEIVGPKGKTVRPRLGSVDGVVTLPKSMCKLLPAKPDGSCLFQSLGYWLELDPFETRKRICNYIQRDASRLSIGDITLQEWIETESDLNLRHYLDNLRKQTTWGGQAELFACSQQFNAAIFVWETDPSYPQNYILRHKFKSKDKIARLTCHVLFDGSNHYDAINLLPSVASRIYN
jgi:OTU-like cysteine protease